MGGHETDERGTRPGAGRLTDAERERLDALAAPLEADELVRSMAGFTQHGCVSTLDHVRSVTSVAFLLNARLHIGGDERTIVYGAMLHDFYLYDWHGAGLRHGYHHPVTARENAVARFGVDRRIQRVIESHMWPWPPTRVPLSREAVCVCVADKVVALAETLFRRRRTRRRGTSG